MKTTMLFTTAPVKWLIFYAYIQNSENGNWLLRLLQKIVKAEAVTHVAKTFI